MSASPDPPETVLRRAPDLALAMVEIHAQRGADSLHNHAAHLCRIRDGSIVEWWMVEALAAGSDAFWRQP